jgi:hypothetical protein
MKESATGRCPVAVFAAVAGVILGAVVLSSAPARAASGLVILLQSNTASPGQRRCLTRIREELVAGGFEVAVVDSGPQLDPISIAGAIERQRGSVATMALLGDPELGPSELWILDRVGARAEVRRITATTSDPTHVPEVLAIRTIELLRASALKLLMESNQPPPPEASPPSSTASVTVGLVRERPEAVGLEAGLAVLESVGGPGPAAIPVGRLRLALLGPLFARLTLAGLGTRPRVTTPLGTTDIGQNLGLVEIGAVFRRHRRLNPVVTVGAGVLYVRSDGDGVYPYQGIEDSRWTALVDGGLGFVALLEARVALTFEIHASLAAPHPLVRFSGTDAATIGRPALLATWTLMTWL